MKTYPALFTAWESLRSMHKFCMNGSIVMSFNKVLQKRLYF